MKAHTIHSGQETTGIPEYIKTGEDIIGNSITDIPKLVDPIFPKVGVIAMAGSSDTGKSSLLRQLAMEIVTEKETFLGFPIKAEHNSVLYISTEDDYYALSSTMKKQNISNDVPEKFKNLRFIFDSINIHDKVVSELEREPVDVIIVDAFSDLYGGDMNRVNEVRNYLQKFSNLANEHQCLVIFLHHTSKRTEDNPPSKHNMIGSQGFEAKMRVVVELRRDYQDPSSPKRHFCIVKGNYLEESFKSCSYAVNFSNDLVFSQTGERVPFEDLAPQDGRRGRNNGARERAIELHGQEMTIDEIHEQLQSEGITVARSTVGNYVNQNNRNGQ